MTERAFVVLGLLVLAVCGVFLIAAMAAWIRDLHQRAVTTRKDPTLFVDHHRAERQRELRRLGQSGAKGLSEESKRAHLQAVTKIGNRR